jgi:hypothetical protein
MQATTGGWPDWNGISTPSLTCWKNTNPASRGGCLMTFEIRHPNLRIQAKNDCSPAALY